VPVDLVAWGLQLGPWAVGPGLGAGGRVCVCMSPGPVFVCPGSHVQTPRAAQLGPWPVAVGRVAWAASLGPWPPVRAPWRVGKGPATRGPKKRAGCKLRGL
jgi:hypothetical protein